MKPYIHPGLKGLFTLALLAIAGAKLTTQPALVTSFEAMGYPLFLMTILGVAYLAGLVGIWQTVSARVREWAYAGFTFALLGAIASHIFAGDPLSAALPSVILLALLTAVQVLEHRRAG